jgi:RND family efflux transporter MFP subunit
MKTLRRILIVLVIAAAGFAGGLAYSRRTLPAAGRAPAAKAVRYHCPMHPNYVSDEPGTCPICGMKLVPIDDAPPSGAGVAPATSVTGEQAASTRPAGAFRVGPEKQQLIGVTYGQVETTPTERTLRAVGSVAVDERRITRVHTRVDGWIESVSVDFTGKPVRAGQRLLTIYSPDLLATQQEFLLARRQRDAMRGSEAAPGMLDDGEALVDAARRRLELWGLSAGQIAEVARTGAPVVQVPLLSPVTGYVVTRNAFPGQRVGPETELYTLADLRTVWILADVFERDVPLVRPGMAARISVPSTDRRMSGRVDFIQPQLDPATRTLKLRIETANLGQLLKPDMFVDVEIALPGQPRLTVPVASVLDSGTRQVVFVDRGEGFLERREVQIGDRVGDRVVIAAGLARGERIVTSGTFLIDSESQLRTVTSGTADRPAPGVHQHD